jgi:hypothetical protein
MKLTFEAVAERVSPDEIVKMIIDELSGKPATKTEATAEVATEEKKKFGRK